jgi:dihydroxyacetone kinase-like predicted kinase
VSSPRRPRIPATPTSSPAALLKKLIERGEDALARTPDQLAVLREAGVVDAGGAGLLEIVRGVSAALSGEPLPDAPAEDAHEAGLDAVHQEMSEFRYCTVFVIEEKTSRPRCWKPSWSSWVTRCSWSATRARSRCTSTPTSRARRSHSGQRWERSRESRSRTCTSRRRSAPSGSSKAVPDATHTLETGVVAVVPGTGTAVSSRATAPRRVIEGGQSMNPSTADIVAAIEATPATEVLVLRTTRT